MDNNKTVQEAWEKYVLNDEEIPTHILGVRDEIIRSWKRCKQHLNPNIKYSKELSEEELDTSIKKTAY